MNFNVKLLLRTPLPFLMSQTPPSLRLSVVVAGRQGFSGRPALWLKNLEAEAGALARDHGEEHRPSGA